MPRSAAAALPAAREKRYLDVNDWAAGNISLPNQSAQSICPINLPNQSAQSICPVNLPC
jgi:hypothetical protein